MRLPIPRLDLQTCKINSGNASNVDAGHLGTVRHLSFREGSDAASAAKAVLDRVGIERIGGQLLTRRSQGELVAGNEGEQPSAPSA